MIIWAWHKTLFINQPTNQSDYLIINYNLFINNKKRNTGKKGEKQGSDWLVEGMITNSNPIWGRAVSEKKLQVDFKKKTGEIRNLRSSHLRWGKVVKSSAGTSFKCTSWPFKVNFTFWPDFHSAHPDQICTQQILTSATFHIFISFNHTSWVLTIRQLHFYFYSFIPVHGHCIGEVFS